MYKITTWTSGLFSLILLGCQSTPQAIDLYNKVGQPAEANFESNASKKTIQHGHYASNNGTLELVDEGEEASIYNFDQEKAVDVKFQGKAINEDYGAKVVVYRDSVAFISIKAHESAVDDYFSTFIRELGEPNGLDADSIELKSIDASVKSSLEKAFPNTVQVYKDDFNTEVLHYPQQLFYVKGNVSYFISLDPIGNKVNLNIDIISEKALNDAVITGYHVSQ
ncbi:hypothetical protein HX021_00125 [Sphingobacterium sp. N143]|uniref:hypothetical protein n=1 Tax=Sphingobacterium sp. N143 TaxID=2746727 RepID=UPI002575C8C4|nr:hypothetical protein [Sphingobacterium sp. N143]MDM1292698.1 hypothetical protein [Sphingobacterium sp. N143]